MKKANRFFFYLFSIFYFNFCIYIHMYKSKASDFNCKKPKNINLNIHFEAKKFFFLYGLYINKYYIYFNILHI